MSSVNTILISTDCAVARALRLQFSSRGRLVLDVSPQSIEGLHATQLESAVVVDLCWGNESLRRIDDLSALVDSHVGILSRCAAANARYLMLSSGQVFEGLDSSTPVGESVAIEPSSELACVLDAAEQRVQKALLSAQLILRSGPLLSTAPGNLLYECVAALREERARALSSLPRSCPTPVADLARVISAIVDQIGCGANCQGIYHYNSSGACGSYEFVEVVHAYAAQFLLASSVITEDERGERWDPWIPELACQKMLGHFGIKQLPWRAWLPKLIKNLCEEES